MKKLIYAAGVLSLGGVNLAVQAAEGGNKPWTVGLTTQGFYDDNINTAPDNVPGGKVGSWGIYVSPNVSYAQSWDSTSLSLGASYGAYYYADTKNSFGQDTFDDDWSQTASFNVDVNHTFNPRLSLDLSDDFALFQNANQLLIGQTGRINGNNISNDGKATLTFEMSTRWSVVVGYENVLFSYEEDQYAAVLDRMENYGRLDLRYLLTPTTVAVVGTKIGFVDYNSGLGMYFPGLPSDSLFNPSSDVKDNRSYFAYGGFDHTFAPNFTGSLRAGAEIQEYTNFDVDTQLNPYVDVSLTYTYRVNSTAQVGIIHRTNASDVTGFVPGSVIEGPTLEQISTAMYVNVSHAITGKLTGTLSASWQSSEFVGGVYDGENEEWWAVGASASYAILKNLSATVSYYYDLLNSDIPTRDYNRNRVFFGLTATY